MSDTWIEQRPRCCFQYALSHRSQCEGCNENIPFKALRAKCEDGRKFYHFDCFWKYETTAKCTKDEIMIAVKPPPLQRPNNVFDLDISQLWDGTSFNPYYHLKNGWHYKMFWNNPYVSLESLDQNIPEIVSIIRPEDIDRIRQHVALAQEGKTSYYIPTVKRKDYEWFSCVYCSDYKSAHKLDTEYYLVHEKAVFHPKCLAEAGIINIDAKDMHGYDILEDFEKKQLDELFIKKEGADTIFSCYTRLDDELCAATECDNKALLNCWSHWEQPKEETFYHQNYGIQHWDLRIRYKHLSYHPRCFAELGRVNVDGIDIPNYDKMNERNKMILDSYFIKKDDFDMPLVEKAKKPGYCNAAECLVSQGPSKFPYPYSIKKDQLQILFQGYNYHPKCFEVSGKVNMNAKDMKNYDRLTDEEKRHLDGIFKKVEKRKLDVDQSSSITVGKDDEAESSTKKKKLSDEDGNKHEVEGSEHDEPTIMNAEENMKKETKLVKEGKGENDDGLG